MRAMTIVTLHVFCTVACVGQDTILTGCSIPTTFIQHSFTVCRKSLGLNLFRCICDCRVFTETGCPFLAIAGSDAGTVPCILTWSLAVAKYVDIIILIAMTTDAVGSDVGNVFTFFHIANRRSVEYGRSFSDIRASAELRPLIVEQVTLFLTDQQSLEDTQTFLKEEYDAILEDNGYLD